MFYSTSTSGRPDPVKIILLLLLATDGIFIVLHLVHTYTPFLHPVSWSIEQDRGYAEIYQYVKEYWVTIMLGLLCWHTKEWIYSGWSFLYFYFLGDDCFQFHENGGYLLVKHFGWQDAFDLRAQDFGEMTVSAIAGTIFLLVIASNYRRSSEDAKNASKDLALLVGVLVFCGVFIDMLHIMLGGDSNIFMGVLEDGGELVAMSLTGWYVFNLILAEGKVPASLWATVIVPSCNHLRIFGHSLTKLLMKTS